MNHNDRQPLDPQERALADALANMPTLEPSPELNARILADARTALHSSTALPRRSRRLRWLSASFGSAAVAVLAAGIAWQSGLFELSHRSSEAMLPAPIVVDNHDIVPMSAPAPSPAPATPPAPMSRSAMAEHSPTSAKAVDDVVKHASSAALHGQQAATANDQARTASSPPTAEVDASARQDPARLQQRVAPPPATPAPTPARVPEAEPAREAITAGEAPLPADANRIPTDWRQDSSLSADAWLDRIRTRLKRGDRDDAVASLHRFVEKHPAHAVPDELAGLLEQ